MVRTASALTIFCRFRFGRKVRCHKGLCIPEGGARARTGGNLVLRLAHAYEQATAWHTRCAGWRLGHKSRTGRLRMLFQPKVMSGSRLSRYFLLQDFPGH